ncbi:DNA-binding protein [Gammaproteobacteria bacterium]
MRNQRNPSPQPGVCRHSPAATNPGSIVLDEYELAAYWKISVKTVRRWRRELLGPAFCKVGTRSVYPLSEIEAFERRMSRNTTSLRAYR